MKGWLAGALVAAAAALACGGDGDGTGANAGGNGGSPNGTPPAATATSLLPGGNTDAPTPSSLDEARDELTAQLDAIGVNIGAVPDDIRADLLEDCGALTQFADEDEVEGICRAIEEAIDANDPGQIDRILSRIEDLEQD
jgi:hypothetical protein